MEISLIVLKYMYISLLLKMINGFSWPAKIMVSPFKFIAPYIQMAWPFQQKFHIYIFRVMILQMQQKTKFWKIQLSPLTWLGHDIHHALVESHKVVIFFPLVYEKTSEPF